MCSAEEKKCDRARECVRNAASHSLGPEDVPSEHSLEHLQLAAADQLVFFEEFAQLGRLHLGEVHALLNDCNARGQTDGQGQI
eukprot:3724225-Pleurochrysis_carterae.AAC.2